MFRAYRQLEHSDCGLTCIRMVARHFGTRVPLRHLHSLVDVNRLGVTIGDLTSCCQSLGLEAAAVKVPPEYVSQMPLPAILYWQQKHFVVLYGISRTGKFLIADPANGKIACDREQFISGWIPKGSNTGIAVLAAPGEDYQPSDYGRDGIFRRFLGYLAHYARCFRKSLCLTLLVTLLVMVADCCLPMLMRRSVDEGIMLKDIGLIWALLLCQLGIVLGSLVASSTINILLAHTGLGMHLAMVNSFLEKLAKFPLSFFDRRVSSDFIKKLNDHSRLQGFLITTPTSLVMAILTLGVFSVLLAHYNITIFLVFFVMSIIEIGWTLVFLGKRKSIDCALFAHTSENYTHAHELTTGMADLKVNNAESTRIARWKATQQALNAVSLKASWIGVWQGGGRDLIAQCKNLVVAGLGAIMVVNGEISLGVMMTLGYITGRLSQPFNSIATTITSLQDALLSHSRIDEVMADDSEQRGTMPYTCPTISLSHVWFKYPGAASPFVIRDVSLHIEPGQTVALVGESGCGKSTLIKLMLGFYEPQRGMLQLSGHDVKDLDNSDWLRHCGVVMQECKVFTGSIIDNVTLSDAEPDEEAAMELLEMVGLADFVDSLPMKAHTGIGMTGIEMSGGQRQRLMIARALYKRPEILFLDEATSSLDANNERSILERIMRRDNLCTIIVAAHRLSTVQNADIILYIDKGEIREYGTHAELIAQEGLYYRLVQNQLQLSS